MSSVDLGAILGGPPPPAGAGPPDMGATAGAPPDVGGSIGRDHQ
jgi:hypothetical protein